jgi:glycosyltransferase involved in cell wall biosynthesis
MSGLPGVLHLVHNFEVGGAQRLILELCAGLQAEGRYRPIVCAWRRGGGVESALREKGIATTVLGLPRRSLWLTPVLLSDVMRIVRRIETLARRSRVSLIHAHLPDSALWGALVGWRLGCPVVVTCHSNTMIPYDLLPGTPRHTLRHWLLRWATHRVDRTIAVSPSVKRAVCAATAVPPERVTVVTNGIPIPAGRATGDRTALRRGLTGRPQARLVTFVGRLVSNKGQRGLVAMMPALLAWQPAACLVLVGDGPEREALRAEAERLGVGSNVVLTGERRDVPAILDASDVFVSASLFEGISLALLEAMAAGLPVVARAVPGNVEVLAEGAGLLVPGDDPESLARAVDRVLVDPALAAALSLEARRRVEERYAMGRVVAQVSDIYDELLHAAPPPPSLKAVAP